MPTYYVIVRIARVAVDFSNTRVMCTAYQPIYRHIVTLKTYHLRVFMTGNYQDLIAISERCTRASRKKATCSTHLGTVLAVEWSYQKPFSLPFWIQPLRWKCVVTPKPYFYPIFTWKRRREMGVKDTIEPLMTMWSVCKTTHLLVLLIF